MAPFRTNREADIGNLPLNLIAAVGTHPSGPNLGQQTEEASEEPVLRGRVDSIQLGSGSKFTAFPPENATGTFKIVIDRGLDPRIPLPLGISAEPTVTER
jgi:hypothetical protein